MEKYYRLSKKERNGTRVFGDYINERAHDKRLLGKDSTADLYRQPVIIFGISAERKNVGYRI